MLPPIAPPAARSPAPPPSAGPAHRTGAAADHQLQRAAGLAQAPVDGAETAQRVDPASAAPDTQPALRHRSDRPGGPAALPDPDPPSGPEPSFQRSPLDEVRDKAEQRLADPAQARRPAGGNGDDVPPDIAAKRDVARGADRPDAGEGMPARPGHPPAEADRAAAAYAASPARAGGAATAPRLNALS